MSPSGSSSQIKLYGGNRVLPVFISVGDAIACGGDVSAIASRCAMDGSVARCLRRLHLPR